jgi:PPP family 3-phenylpropionic acid transporter
MAVERIPYWRLSAFYFFYFASLGALVPFWGLYLKDRGFDALAIGQLTAILLATKIVAPNVWGWLADRSGRRLPIVRLASLLSALTFTGIFLAQDFWTLALVMSLFSFFWNASLPQIEAVTFSHLQTQVRRYASIRLWGSIGFIVTVYSLGRLLDRYGPSTVPAVVWAMYLAIWFSSLLIPEAESRRRSEAELSLRAVLGRPEVAAFLFSCFLMQASHGTYYAFYSIYLQSAQYASATIGWLWAWGVLVEVLVFLGMHWVLDRWAARQVLLASLFLALVRWLLTAQFVDSLVIMILAQTLHAATFGAFHAAAIHLVHHYFLDHLQGRGQALYSSLSFGAGGAFGSLTSGYLWSQVGALATFSVAAAIAGLGWLIAWRWVDPQKRY